MYHTDILRFWLMQSVLTYFLIESDSGVVGYV